MLPYQEYICYISHPLHYIRVSETKTILIGDFGLAGDLYSSDQHQSAVRLPVKWMPPESLKDGVSNEKTDMVYVHMKL